MTTREQQAQQTYNHILNTAEQLLKTANYDTLSVSQICAQAGISKGGFYHHFSSKDQLIALLIGRQMERLIQKQVEPLLGTENAFTLLTMYIHIALEYLKQNPKDTLARCWLALSEHDELTSSLASQAYFKLLHNIVLQGIKDGSIREDIDPVFCEKFLASSYTGIMLHAIAYNETCDLEHFVNQSMELIHSMLQP